MAILVHIQKQPDQILWKKKCITQDFITKKVYNSRFFQSSKCQCKSTSFRKIHEILEHQLHALIKKL